MLSNQSERKVQSLLSAMEEEMVESIRPQLIEIKDTFQQAYDTEGKEEQGRHSQCRSVPHLRMVFLSQFGVGGKRTCISLVLLWLCFLSEKLLCGCCLLTTPHN